MYSNLLDMHYSAECISTDKRDSLKIQKILLCICVFSSFGYMAAKDLQVINRLTTIVYVFRCCYSVQSTVVQYSLPKES